MDSVVVASVVRSNMIIMASVEVLIDQSLLVIVVSTVVGTVVGFLLLSCLWSELKDISQVLLLCLILKEDSVLHGFALSVRGHVVSMWVHCLPVGPLSLVHMGVDLLHFLVHHDSNFSQGHILVGIWSNWWGMMTSLLLTMSFLAAMLTVHFMRVVLGLLLVTMTNVVMLLLSNVVSMSLVMRGVR